MSNTRSSRSAEVPRSWPEAKATDELRLAWEFLGFLRATAVNKVADLDRAAAVAAPWPASPGMSLLGVLKHLTAVERYWLSIVGGGADLPSLWEGSPDPSFLVGEHEDPASVVADYVAEWRRSEDALAGRRPDDVASPPSDEEEFTVRWLLAHVSQETARHVGHLDALREAADGRVGE
ncbi:DUF664 domain-containing protein [Solihabitans fulvus]|uniref:DUF664 domain-containing protein n=1 Tax=Solihabitans fulvus TaxID=1892852 RepID=A0A5B2X0S2_9PSEU|nr:DUF664 domain-containing protein [Solihabitans fulvus]KAA2256924.1 DUF664 domain-containing protein [Solihabitans fulvus]